ncbi:MAG: hypothetical protein OXF31_11495 [Gammaproteobacteria bacterium]|nr:hypothetical protein [Gammaproteobacteria bacterium]
MNQIYLYGLYSAVSIPDFGRMRPYLSLNWRKSDGGQSTKPCFTLMALVHYRFPKPVVLFCHHENLIIFLGQLKHSDKAAIQKLRRDWTADVIGKFARAKFNILPRLHGGQLIFSPLCLHRHDVFSAIRVDSDIEFVDLNLPNSLNGRSQVIL